MLMFDWSVWHSTNPSSSPCAIGYSNTGVNFNNGDTGKAYYVYMCFKEGNYTITPTNRLLS